jgi:hypothetical protein
VIEEWNIGASFRPSMVRTTRTTSETNEPPEHPTQRTRGIAETQVR